MIIRRLTPKRRIESATDLADLLGVICVGKLEYMVAGKILDRR